MGQEIKYFKCFSSRLAARLTRAGFAIVRTEPNWRKPQYDVFVFEQTPELMRIVQQYSKR